MEHSANHPVAISCTCTSQFQDKEYGRGKRLHNPMKKEDWYRCTVCGAMKAYTPRKMGGAN